MKKIIILFLTLIIITGCYDNVELDDLSLVTGIGIDYKDNNYFLTYEILNDNKSDNSSDLLSYTIHGSGKTISEAFVNTNYSMSKKPYFAHLKVMIFSENVIKDKLKEIIEYIFRNVNIREEFITLISKDVTPKEILESSSKYHPVVSNYIVNLLDYGKFNNGIAINETFKELVKKLASEKHDILINSIGLKDENVYLANSYIFSKYNVVNSIDMEESSFYTLLSNKTFNTVLSQNDVVLSINKCNKDIKVLNDKIIIDLKLEGTILENNSNMDLKDPNSYSKIDEDFSKMLNEKIKDFIKKLQFSNSDILGFKDIYYKKNNKDNKFLWLNADVIVNTKVVINDKGYIFGVER